MVGLDSGTGISYALLVMDLNCKKPDAAEKVFNGILEQTVVLCKCHGNVYFKNIWADQLV